MIVLFGNSGHAGEIENLLFKKEIEIDYFIVQEKDIKNTSKEISESYFLKVTQKKNNLISAYLGIGEKLIREKIFRNFPSLNYPNLYTEGSLPYIYKPKMGLGNVIFESASISVNCKIGDFNHINAFTTISHDFYCESFNTISPGVIIAGNVSIGSNTFIGAGVTIIDKIKICSNVTIGAGAVVVENIEKPGLYFGCPAKFIKSH